MDRNLKADKDSHSEGDPDDGQGRPHLMGTQVPESNFLDQMKESQNEPQKTRSELKKPSILHPEDTVGDGCSFLTVGHQEDRFPLFFL